MSNRLGEHYVRYSSYNVQPNQNNKYNRNPVITNNDVKLSVLQEPEINYTYNEYYLAINSSKRDTTLYPSPNSYVIDLPREYKNIKSIELLDATIPDKNNVTRQPYLVLNIKEINDVIDSIDPVLNQAFAVLKMDTPIQSGYFITLDKNCWEKMPKIYKQPKANLSRFSISITDRSGNLFNFLESSPTDITADHSLYFKIITLETDRAELRHRNVN
jgi:hypothetical protein